MTETQQTFIGVMFLYFISRVLLSSFDLVQCSAFSNWYSCINFFEFKCLIISGIWAKTKFRTILTQSLEHTTCLFVLWLLRRQSLQLCQFNLHFPQDWLWFSLYKVGQYPILLGGSIQQLIHHLIIMYFSFLFVKYFFISRLKIILPLIWKKIQIGGNFRNICKPRKFVCPRNYWKKKLTDQLNYH